MAELAMALHIAGYDPCIGYYHQLSHARESLACDLLEPLRPLADTLCLHIVASQTLTAEHFATTNAGCLLGKASRPATTRPTKMAPPLCVVPSPLKSRHWRAASSGPTEPDTELTPPPASEACALPA